MGKNAVISRPARYTACSTLPRSLLDDFAGFPPQFSPSLLLSETFCVCSYFALVKCSPEVLSVVITPVLGPAQVSHLDSGYPIENSDLKSPEVL